MSINLNEAPSGSGPYDRDAISNALRPIAYKWVPAMFPNGRMASEKGNKVWRCADIKGRAPKDKGSCVIQLEGDHAGSWCDWENPTEWKGGPLSTIKKHLGLNEGQVYQIAFELIDQHGARDYLTGAKTYKNGSAGTPAINRMAGDIEFILAQCVPAPGTIAETVYWPARKLGDRLPPAAYIARDDGKPDILFAPNAGFKELNASFPTVVCRFRYPDGELTGAIHLTRLLADGAWHIGGIERFKDEAKKTWGPRINGGLVQLAPISAAGELGIGEGIESTAAGMVYFPGVGAWASCGTAAMVKAGEWLQTADRSQTAPIKRLLIWGDAGKGGIAAALTTAAHARAAGIPAVELYLPRGGDDLAADLLAGLPAPEPLTPEQVAVLGSTAPAGQSLLPLDAEAAAPAADGTGEVIPPGPSNIAAQPAWAGAVPAGPQPTLSEIGTRLMALEKGVSGDVVLEILRQIVGAQLDPINEETMINLMYRKTGIKKRTIEEMLRELKGQNIIQSGGEQTRPWLKRMALGSDGDPKGIMSNVAIALRNAEEFKGSLGFNEFTGMISVLRKLPWEIGYPNPCEDRPWTDDDELAVMEWVQSIAGIHAPRGAIFDAVQRVASENKFHPVREYLSSLVWDHVPRLDKAASYYFGAEDTSYHREVFKRWVVSAVARIYRPGCKVDCMTVFEGEQGLGKSTAIRILFDPWFTDQLSEMGTKDASLELRGIWCAEYSDLEGMTKAEAKTIKSYMSRTTDRFRPPYGRMVIKVERQMVFAATTNEYEYLKDATGGRRFWPIRCKAIDLKALASDKDQLWAEAVAIFIGKLSKWWIDEVAEPELAIAAAEIVDARFQSSAFEQQIGDWFEQCPLPGCPLENTPGNRNCSVKPTEASPTKCPREQITIADIMGGALHIDPSKWDTLGLQTRVGIATMRVIRNRNLPWRRDRINRVWCYVRLTSA